ncbi:hypothetical protein HOY80DRAFT_713712 [Tuber brumale]|nr:hypothetical protein HOY80DRAFT_713712 [Tuber brumale]
MLQLLVCTQWCTVLAPSMAGWPDGAYLADRALQCFALQALGSYRSLPMSIYLPVSTCICRRRLHPRCRYYGACTAHIVYCAVLRQPTRTGTCNTIQSQHKISVPR